MARPWADAAGERFRDLLIVSTVFGPMAAIPLALVGAPLCLTLVVAFGGSALLLTYALCHLALAVAEAEGIHIVVTAWVCFMVGGSAYGFPEGIVLAVTPAVLWALGRVLQFPVAWWNEFVRKGRARCPPPVKPRP